MADIIQQTKKNPAGRIFKEWYTCSSCGLEVHHGDKFCAHCGVKFR